jgi:hypothetical protein
MRWFSDAATSCNCIDFWCKSCRNTPAVPQLDVQVSLMFFPCNNSD